MHEGTLSGEDPGLSRFTWVSFGGMTSAVAVLTVLLVASLCALVLLWHSRSPRDFGSPAERAVFEAFHTASLAAPFETGRILVAGPEAVACGRFECPVRHAVVAPLTVEDRVVGSLVVFSALTSSPWSRHRCAGPACTPFTGFSWILSQWIAHYRRSSASN
jgi:hypothetical protein